MHPPPFAATARLLHGEKALLHAHLAGTATRGATDRRRALRRAVTATGRAFDQGRDVNLAGMAEHGLFELEFEFIAQVGAAEHLAATAAAATTKDVAKDFPKDVAEGFTGIHPPATTVLGVQVPPRV